MFELQDCEVELHISGQAIVLVLVVGDCGVIVGGNVQEVLVPGTLWNFKTSTACGHRMAHRK